VKGVTNLRGGLTKNLSSRHFLTIGAPLLHRVVEKLQAHLRKLGIHQVMRKKALSDNIGTTN